MAVSGEHRPLDGSLPHELTSMTPFPGLKLLVLIGILSLSIALLIYLCVRLSRTSKKCKTPAKEVNLRPSSGSSYEVFLSFRGPDTRHGFTDFLYHRMVESGILVFRDNESLHVGKRIGNELRQAIENSKIYIPIFSENNASSHWCLRELTYMVECTFKSNENKEILPIFLDVKPDDIKLKTKLYGKALSKHWKNFDAEVVESWEKALIEVGKIKGWNLKEDESQADLIQSVIKTVLDKLNIGHAKILTDDLVGVDDRVEAIIKMLDVRSDSVQFLGIHGMGGIGKTTIAKVIFNQLSSHFRGCNFLSDIGESSRRHGLVHLQKQLLSKFPDSRSSLDQIHDMDDGINIIKRVLFDKKVLIVLDDVDGKEQLKSLAGKSNWFGSGSRIIITTRDQSVLRIEGEAIGEGPVEKSAKVSTYEMREMEFDDALKLFSRHAFRRDSPPDHYVSLSNEVVSTLGKLPLALEVTGSALNNEPKEFWEATLKKLKDAPPNEVQSKLMISYDKLDNEQKQIFLDIACFFINWDIAYPFYMWDACGYHPHVATKVLFLMSFIKIRHDNTFWMHDQIRDLGREIVRRENYEDTCKRSRIWNPKEAWSILKGKEASRKIKALSLDFLGGKLTPDEFAKLQNLRFFEGYGVSLTGDFNNLLSNLRWLSCRHCPSKFEAKNFHLTNLVVLDLSYSEISQERIGWIKEARKLKVLDLSHCNNLWRIPDLSTLVSLERLILQGCQSLREIDASIGKLKLLSALNLYRCCSLKELPEEIGCLQALIEIVMPDNLQKLPETIGDLKSLLTFDFSNRRISKLPNSIGGMVKLTVLTLSGCQGIKELPDSVGKLQSLVELDLSWTRISHLPDSIGNLKQLKVLSMSHMRGITKLPSAIGLLEKLEELDACGCRNLTGAIPEEIGRLSCLMILDLSDTHIIKLPTTMSHLSNLQTLILESCPKLKQLPELSPSLICLRWGTDSVMDFYEDNPYELESVTALPTSINILSQLETLRLSCKQAQCLPQLPPSLRELELRHLATIQSPDFSNLKYLSILRIYCCSMSECLGIYDAELEAIYMEKCMFRKLDALYQLQMERSRHLEMFGCEFLPEVLDLSNMKNLQEVDLFGCKLLVEIRGLEELRSLCFLSVVDCSSMERMSNLSKLGKLRELIVRECPKLRNMEGLSNLKSLKKLWIHDCRSLQSLAGTSNLDLECSMIIGCEQLPNCDNYCRCPENSCYKLLLHILIPPDVLS